MGHAKTCGFYYVKLNATMIQILRDIIKSNNKRGSHKNNYAYMLLNGKTNFFIRYLRENSSFLIETRRS